MDDKQETLDTLDTKNKVLLSFLVLFIISFCVWAIFIKMPTIYSDKGIQSGEIYKLECREEKTELAYIPIRIVHENAPTQEYLKPYYYEYPERYVVYIKKRIDDVWEYTELYVPKETYQGLKKGDIYEFDKSRDLSKEPCNITEAKDVEIIRGGI